MFEIRKRHSPMFIAAEVKQVATAMNKALALDTISLNALGVEIVPPFQTARINENNQLIVRSELSLDAVTSILNADNRVKELQSHKSEPSFLLEAVLKNMIEYVGVDSYVLLGNQLDQASYGLEKFLKPFSSQSRKPLIVFNSADEVGYDFADPNWIGMDHPALWLDDSIRLNTAYETEAFFAISPALKIEVALNRYHNLENFGSIAVGMVGF